MIARTRMHRGGALASLFALLLAASPVGATCTMGGASPSEHADMTASGAGHHDMRHPVSATEVRVEAIDSHTQHATKDGGDHGSHESCPHSGPSGCDGLVSCGAVALDAPVDAHPGADVSRELVDVASASDLESAFLPLWRPPPKSH